MPNNNEKQEIAASRLLRKIKIDIENATAQHESILIAINNDKKLSSQQKATLKLKNEKLVATAREIERLSKIQKDYEKRLDEQNETIKTTNEVIGSKSERIKVLDKEIETIDEAIKKQKEEAQAEIKKDIYKEEAVLVKLRTEKDTIEDDLSKEHKKLKTLSESTEEIKTYKKNIANDITKANKELDKLSNSIEEGIKELSVLDSKIETGKKELAGLDDSIKTARAKLTSLNSDINIAQKEKEKADIAISEAQAKYDVEKKRLFNISAREKHVMQQEAFVKERFAEAGIAYTEYSG